jgi:hypothetical protein
MTRNSISTWCTRILVGGLLWLGGQTAWAVGEPTAVGPLQPVPDASPATGVLAPGQPGTAALPEQVSAATSDEGLDCCGLPLCGPPGRFWLRADYLLWWTNGMRLPPLVTTSPAGTQVDRAGVLGYPNTSILFGNTTVGDDGRSGFRTTLGMWLDCCNIWDLEFDYLSLGQRTSDFSASSSDYSVLARPFFNVQTNKQASELVSLPGTVTGAVSAHVTDYFQSVGVLLSRNLCSCDSCQCNACDFCDGCAPLLFCCRTDLLFGMRYYNLSDFTGVTEDLDQVNPIANYVIHDNFRASNEFYGGEIGLRTQLYRGRWSLDILTKIAIGNNHQTVNIDGSTAVTADGTTLRYDGGILAGKSNSGNYIRDDFAVIPQLSVELGYQWTCHWRTYVGYSLIYWGDVVRSANQIDLNLDPRNFPPATSSGLPFPAYSGATSSFWAQGMNVGLEFRF